MERYVNGHWFEDFARAAWVYVRAGYYEEGVQIPNNAVEHTISDVVIRQLIKALDEAGWIKPRLDERLRTEDLKITHRLLDLLEKR